MNEIYTLETGVMVEGGYLECVTNSLENVKRHPMYKEKDVRKFFKRCPKKNAIWYRLVKKWDLELGGYELVESTYYEPNNTWDCEFSWGTIQEHRLKQKKIRKRIWK